MRSLLNSMAGRAQQAGASFTGTREGIITSYDPAEYAIKVVLQPDGAETGWIPLDSPWVGNGWGLAAGPMIGASIKIDFDSGNISNGSGSGQHYNDIDRCPSPQSGEFFIVHKSGASFKLTNDGKVTVTDSAGSEIVMKGDGSGEMTFSSGLTVNANVKVNGDFVASGNISDQNGVKGVLQKIRDLFNAHGHGGVQTGTGTTNTPNNSM
ncbi:baseplate assembly protein [Yersinia alsatica]|uniref:baseplate assembly protein n=1 Tax=Yersinia alsatica TaxID=2890317 RepID=UPI0011A0EEA2|nr:baseplate assembly protein [Yersinia alsatica]